MATFSREQVTVTTVRYVVPTPSPWGATFAELVKAYHAASAEYREARGIAPGEALSDDAIMVRAEDGRIVLSFERPRERES